MDIVVLGGGVIGITTAYQLARDGHAVQVIDKADEAASFTSFANAGLVAPGHAYAWASPKAPGLMLRSLWRKDQAIRFSPSLSPALWSWAWKFLKECTMERAMTNTRHKLRLCLYSQKILKEVVEQTGVIYDGQEGGLIYFYRTQRSFDAAAHKCELLRQGGATITALDRDEVAAKDPGLANFKEHIAGALYAPGDESGDARLFTLALAKVCETLGVTFRYGETVLSVKRDRNSIASVETDLGEVRADAYVLCLGIYSPHVVEDLGLRLPIYPVRGYSATLKLNDRLHGPQLGGVDEDNLLAYCPMGERLRLTATAEISGYDTSYRPCDFAGMLAKGRMLFGDAADFDAPKLWVGLRPMTPTGLPVIDRSPFHNLWLNTGHGHIGWTMSNGSARILADLVAQRQPHIDTEGMRYEY